MTLTINQILHISRSGMITRMLDLDQVSHNLANVNTTGYKTSRSNFQEMLNNQIYNGVKMSASQRFMDQGSFKQTNNPLDLAINGKGFFGVTLPDGKVAYSRDGEFSLDANSNIVNGEGFPLVWDGTVPVDAEEVSVEPDGSVMVLQAGIWNQAGSIQLHRFANSDGLYGYGNNLWTETEVSGPVTSGSAGSEGFGDIRSQMLEQSNVSISNEMSQMVILQRSFDLSLRTFQQTDKMIEQAIRMRNA